MLLLVAIGKVGGVPSRLGTTLLVLGTLVSTYLRLMMTNGGLTETVLGADTMLLLMAAVVTTADANATTTSRVLLQHTVAALGAAFRHAAAQRWTMLDWMGVPTGIARAFLELRRIQAARWPRRPPSG